MNKSLKALCAFIGMVVATANSHGVTVLTADLTHDQETTQGALTTSNGDPRALSFGHATFILNDAMTELTFTAEIFNIDVTGTQTPDPNDNLVAAHIHAGAPRGVNAGVRWGFFGTPDNDTNPDDLVVTPFTTGVGGIFSSKWDAPEGNNTTLADQIPNILAGLSYINFHTVQFGGGEIRGQLTLVPDGGMTAFLLGGALLLLRKFRTAAWR